MLTDYQISRIRAFTDSVRAGFCVFPEEQLLELAEILEAQLAEADALDLAKSHYAWALLNQPSAQDIIHACVNLLP